MRNNAISFAGSFTGNGRSNSSLIWLKIAVFAPMPRASVSTATAVKPGFFNSWRKAKRRSFIEALGDSRGAIGERTKHQIPNTKLQRNSKLQIPNAASIPPNWSLRFGAALVFGSWCLVFSFAPERLHGIDTRCATSRQPTGSNQRDKDAYRYGDKGEWIERTN